MKNYLIFFLIIGSFFSCKQSQQSADIDLVINQLDSLFENKEIFEGNRLFQNKRDKLPEFNSLIYDAIVENAFNNSENSNKSISNLFQHYSEGLNDSIKCDLLELKLQNHIKLFSYNQAADITINLIDNYSNHLDSARISDLKNEQNIWNGLRTSPPQLVVRKDYTKIDLIGGLQIPVILNKSESTGNFLFDTGANFSVISKSTAKSMKLKSIDASFTVSGILGDKTTAGLALASSMQFGNIELENVVFLVLPDQALYISEADFQIFGIIGYPVISALDEIQITNNKQIIIPSETSKSSYSNLAMEFLTPVIEVVSKDDSLIFTFDTGAGKTWLYEKYYKRYKFEIDNKYDKTKKSVGGIGGIHQYEAYLIDFQMQIDKYILKQDSTILLCKNITPEHKYYYGNLGRDFIQSFDKMTINFLDMFIDFSNYNNATQQIYKKIKAN